MIFSENRFPPPIEPGAGFFGIMRWVPKINARAPWARDATLLRRNIVMGRREATVPLQPDKPDIVGQRPLEIQLS